MWLAFHGWFWVTEPQCSASTRAHTSTWHHIRSTSSCRKRTQAWISYQRCRCCCQSWRSFCCLFYSYQPAGKPRSSCSCRAVEYHDYYAPQPLLVFYTESVGVCEMTTWWRKPWFRFFKPFPILFTMFTCCSLYRLLVEITIWLHQPLIE